MDFLWVLLAVYWIVTMVTFWVLFYRFVRRDDIRGKDVVDFVDPSDGFLAFVLGIFLLFVVLALGNPIRFAHLVLKAAFWPVTAFFALRARAAEASPSSSSGTVVTSSPPAPRMPADFVEDVLAREGFPATPHNVFALQERLGIMFTIKARQFIVGMGDTEGMGGPQDWDGFLERAGYPRAVSEMPSWPQRVLDALVAWDPDIAPHLHDFPEKYVGILLEGKGSGNGFFGGPPSEPLPTANREWHMKGIGQPDAVPVLPPQPPSVPAPRSVGSRPASSLHGSHPTGTLRAARFAEEPSTGPVSLPPRGAPFAPPRSVPAAATRAPTDLPVRARHAAPPAGRHPVPERPSPDGSLSALPATAPSSSAGGRHARPESSPAR